MRKVRKKIGTKINDSGEDEGVLEEVEEKVYAKPTIDNQMGVRHGGLIALLVEAVKEQNLAIEALKNELISIKLLVGK